ncbi:multidrug efflux SMR transporter [Helicobacter sp. MIT 14-3879]|uniref:DMT family transporter n=1 Tax=Helicobacter sp. MIT 14-3879 TaxID=2040649 RepID=UPI000E1E2CE6|nr:multidrug efflux SMR transporter [Helicobacter sp. MIT 14-3879]RDU60203.1 QacE family quaternary ammonium compound efflux SMR transporter [Helicobacter sp. MIT 14-3879]
MRCLKITPNIAWGLVIFGGILECFWVSGLKYADSVILYLLTAVGICISFTCGMLALKVLEVGIAYSVLVGIGTAGVALAEIIVFSEDFSLLKIFFIITLLIGVIGLKLSAQEVEEAEGAEESEEVQKEKQELSCDLGRKRLLEE